MEQDGFLSGIISHHKESPMNEKQINEYLNGLLGDSEINLPDPLENDALQRFRKAVADTARTEARLLQIKEEGDRMLIGIQQLNGQRAAYAQILLTAERSRRAEVPGAPALTLMDLKEQTGADKVEAVDNDGNLLDTTEKADGADNR